MSRTTQEWIGATDDAAIPPRVRLRVFEAHNGRCALTGRKITAADQWDVDHRIALANGGQHRESNLQPVLKTAHQEKTRQDVQIKAKIARVRKKHLGIQQSKKKIPYRRFDGTPVFPK